MPGFFCALELRKEHQDEHGLVPKNVDQSGYQQLYHLHRIGATVEVKNNR